MTRIVFVGGLNGSRKVCEKTAEGIVSSFEASLGVVADADFFTYADSNIKSTYDRLAKAVESAHVISHSAGALAVKNVLTYFGVRPVDTWLFNGPMPRTRAGLLGATLLKTVRMHQPGYGLQSKEDFTAVLRYDKGSLIDPIVHPFAGMRQFMSGKISKFDTVKLLQDMHEKNLAGTLISTANDEYFVIKKEREHEAAEAGLKLVKIPGVHDELLLRPVATIEAAAKAMSST